MTKKKDKEKIKTTKEQQYLKVELTQEEILQAGDNLARAIDNIRKLANDKDSVVKSFKAKETALEAEMTAQQLLVRNKYEYRNVDCENVLDYVTLVTYTKRLDTGKEIMRRDMSQEEKQMTMPFDAEKANPETA